MQSVEPKNPLLQRLMSPEGRHLVYCLALIIVGLAVYLPSLGHDFVPMYDDTMYVLCNSAIRGISAANLKVAFTGFFGGNYAPLHIVSYMLDYTFSGLNPSGYILTNITIHVSNAVLLYYVLIRSGFAAPYACLAASVFLLHPVQVESVVWVSERKTVLSMLFFLAAFHLYVSYVRQGSRAVYLCSLGMFLAGLLSKSIVVVLPLVLMAYDRAYRPVSGRTGKIDKIPFFLLALLGSCLTLYSQDPARNGGMTTYHGGSPLATFFTMLPVLARYIRMVLLPTDLTVYYGSVSTRASFDEDVFLAGLLAAALMAVGVWLYSRRREIFCWYAIFFIGLVPVSQIIPIVTLINDRYLYFPLLGIAGLCAIAIRYLHGRYRRGTAVLAVAGLLLCGTLSWLTYRQSQTWQNTFTLYRQIIRQNKERIDFRILQDGYFLNSNLNGLMEVSNQLLEHFPHSPEALRFEAKVQMRSGNPQAALKSLQQSIENSPNDLDSLFMLADISKRLGLLQEARQIYQRILLLRPDSETAREGLRSIIAD